MAEGSLPIPRCHGRWTPSPCPPEQEAMGSPGERGAEISVQNSAWVLGAVLAQQSPVLAGLAGVAEMLWVPELVAATAGGSFWPWQCPAPGQGGLR